MNESQILSDLQLRSGNAPFVVITREEAKRFEMPPSEYVRIIKNLSRAGRLSIIIEPLGSFYIQVSQLAE